MSVNQFNSVSKKSGWVTMKGLDLLLNDLQVAPYCNTDFNANYDKEFAVGADITVPLPQRYITQRNNMTYNAQPLSRPTTTISVNQTSTITFDWESVEKALDMERGDERAREIYVKPAMAYMRQDIDSDIAQFAYQNANMIVSPGLLGTNPSTFDGTSAAARQALFDMGCPTDSVDLGLFLPSAVVRAVKNSGLSFFNPATDVSKQQRTGMIGVSDGFDWYNSNSIFNHTAGNWSGAVTVTSFVGNALVVACTTGDTFKQGDKVSLAGVNQVNLMTRRTTSTSAAGTKTFTVLADATGVASAATLSVSPAINGPGTQQQNVDALPAVGAALTLWPGTASPNNKVGKVGFAMYRDAILLVGVKMELPTAVEVKSQTQDPDTQIALRFIRQWDNRTSSMTNRLDTLWGRGVGLAEQCLVAVPCA